MANVQHPLSVNAVPIVVKEKNAFAGITHYFFNGCVMIQFILFVFPACFSFLDFLLKPHITDLLVIWVNWVCSFKRALEFPLVAILCSDLFFYIFF